MDSWERGKDKELMTIPWEMRAVLTTFRISAVEKKQLLWAEVGE